LRVHDHVKTLARDQIFDEGEEAGGIAAQAGAAMEVAHKARIARQAPG
jgi:hypothetical protein